MCWSDRESCIDYDGAIHGVDAAHDILRGRELPEGLYMPSAYHRASCPPRRDTDLLLDSPLTTSADECPNRSSGKHLSLDMSLQGIALRQPSDLGPDCCTGGLLYVTLGLACAYAPIYRCRSGQCMRRRALLERSIPLCYWTAFTDVILTVLSCLHLGFLSEIYHCANACLNVQKVMHQEPPYSCVHVMGVIDVLRWAMRVAASKARTSAWKRVPSQYAESLYAPMASLATIRSSGLIGSRRPDRPLEFCPYRLWKLARVCKLGVVDLPHLADSVIRCEELPEGWTGPHADCTEQACLVSDGNSTLVAQAHKCISGDCGRQCDLPLDLVTTAWHESSENANGQDAQWRQTAWSTSSIFSNPQLCPSDAKYMAISHVWSDGTGVGRKPPGQVNECLLRFFVEIAEQLGCTGIWWDAISLPTKKEERQLAVAHMLQNYSRASVTLVHDQELCEFEWQDDGRAAVAVVTAAWFSRGWTAAELFASHDHPVKVLVKNPAARGPPLLIKDLDTEILAFDSWSIRDQLREGCDATNTSEAKTDRPETLEVTRLADELPLDPVLNRNIMVKQEALELRLQGRKIAQQAGNLPHLGYFVASDIIERLRSNRCIYRPRRRITISHMEDLLEVLRGRETSYYRDYLIIAGLMSSIGSGSINSQSNAQITKSILARFGGLRVKDLYHADTPLASHGPWSWCPPSFHSFGQFCRESIDPDDRCKITVSGVLSGQFTAFPLSKAYSIEPVGQHPALTAKVSHACLNRLNCVLLTHTAPEDRKPRLRDRVFVLAYACSTDVGPRWDMVPWVRCQWIACVKVTGVPSEPSLWKVAQRITAVFGDDGYRGPPPAVRVVADLHLFHAGKVLHLLERAKTAFDTLRMCCDKNVGVSTKASTKLHSVAELALSALNASCGLLTRDLVQHDLMRSSISPSELLESHAGELLRAVEDPLRYAKVRGLWQRPRLLDPHDIDRFEPIVREVLFAMDKLRNLGLIQNGQIAQTIVLIATELNINPADCDPYDQGKILWKQRGSSHGYYLPYQWVAGESDGAYITIRGWLTSTAVQVGETRDEMMNSSGFERTARIMLSLPESSSVGLGRIENALAALLCEAFIPFVALEFTNDEILKGFRCYLLLVMLNSIERGQLNGEDSETVLARHVNLAELSACDDTNTIPSRAEVAALFEELKSTTSELDREHELYRQIVQDSWPFTFLYRQSTATASRLILFENGTLGMGPEESKCGDEIWRIAKNFFKPHLLRPVHPGHARRQWIGEVNVDLWKHDLDAGPDLVWKTIPLI